MPLIYKGYLAALPLSWETWAKTQRSDETVPLGREIGLKRIRGINDPHQTTGSIMLTAILNSIYRFLRSSLPASESTGSAFSTR